MKPISLSSVITFVCSLFFTLTSLGQSFGTSSSAVWLSTCTQSNYFNTSGAGPSLIGPAGNVFNNSNLGVHTRNSGTLILRGGEVRTFKTPGVANVCSVRMYYRVYPSAGVPGSFSTIDLAFADDCNTGTFPSGGSCAAGDQKWNRVIANGETVPYAPVNLTSLAAGNYTLEVYYDVTGSSTSTTLCDETVVLNNSGNNYKATFTIQVPDLESSNPTTCNGNQGVITITGLVPGITYAVSYSDDGTPVGPNNYVANASGQINITGLNAGIYADFQLDNGGCSTDLNTGLILSNPVFVPTFPAIPSFCAGTTPPTLPTTSSNGLSGTWSPSVIDNQNSAAYTFTPTSGQCGITITRNVTVIQRTTPTFTFGTSLAICSGGAVPALPGTSTNAINGTWSPAVVSNTTSGTYTFTPTAGQCA
ncbi:MAG: hypothetical protein ACJ75F_03140, partial [Flavisolibacter sp.]